MKIITINIPESYIRAIASLTGKEGLYPSRSELIRVAVREFLIQELKVAKNFGELQSEFTEKYPSKISEEIKKANEVEPQVIIYKEPPKKGPVLDINKIWGIVPMTPHNERVLNQADNEVQEYADHFIISGKKMWKK